MNFQIIIDKKKHKIELSSEELKWLVDNFTKNVVTDYQMAAFNMAVWFNGMTSKETADFTQAMIDTGITYDLNGVEGLKADKHSTGGVGDKTSLIYSPLVASFGVKVAKLSGRGLGQTGGTIDKLESCTGWTGNLTDEEFKTVLNKVGMSILSQSENIVPADKQLYALRDVTGTVDSVPLIASSIMSKKLVIPADSIILDVKCGSGAFMKTIQDARVLSQAMIEIGKHHNRKIGVMITNMDKPLGRAIGNAIEVKEAWDTLHGNGPDDLVELCVTAAAITLIQNGTFSNLKEAKEQLLIKLNNGEAAHFLKDFITAQRGDFSKIENYDSNFTTKYKIEIKAKADGYVKFISAENLGYLSMRLGAGRETKADAIDFAAGIYLNKTSNEFVKKNEVVMTLYTNFNNEQQFLKEAYESFRLLENPANEKIILDILSEIEIK